MAAAHVKAPAVTMPDSGRHLRGCTGKVWHASRAEAVVATKNSARLQPYKCKHCGLWHTTSNLER